MMDHFATFLHDANEFVIGFREIIELSIPHIYVSALPSLDEGSKIAQEFWPKFPSTLKMTVQGSRQKSKTLLEIRGHASAANSVAFSPDGTCIVSGAADKTIRVWDARTGDEVMTPFRGHTDSVLSIGVSRRHPHFVGFI